jgi:hypothetical protein
VVGLGVAVLGTEHPPAPAAEAVRHVHLLATLASNAREHMILYIIEGLNCKKPIQCLASSKILTPPPPHPGECVPPPPLVRGEDTLAGWRGGWGVNILEDARHCSVLYICTYCALHSKKIQEVYRQ